MAAAAPPLEGEEELPPEIVPPLEDEVFQERNELFDQIYEECPPNLAKKASLEEREKASLLDANHLTYGELDMSTLHSVLNAVRQDYGPLYANKGVFLDLGSGAGKACIAAGLLHPFAKVVGIETLQSLTTFATAAHEKYKEVPLPDGVTKPEIEFIKGDFVADFEAKIKPIAADVVICLAVATCYGANEMKAIGELASAMGENSIMITFSQMIPDAAANSINGGWSLVRSTSMEMIWGQTTCFIFKKVAPVCKFDEGDPAEAVSAAELPTKQ